MNQKIILLTGGSAGIGKSIADLLAQQGHTVYCGSRRTFQSTNHNIISVAMDVNSEEQTETVVNQIISEHGRIDAVICNAGNGIAGAIEDTDSQEVYYQFETNFFGVTKTLRACLPIFRQQGFGKIIVTSSVAGIVPIPFQAYYSAVKAALIAYVQALSLEVKGFGIQCCLLLPGDTKTEFTAARKFTKKSQDENSPYYQKTKKSVGRMEHDEQNGMSPLSVAKIAVRQINRKNMSLIAVPGIGYKLTCWLFPMLPAKFRMWIVNILY
ncbi:MAG: SDR family oxidoreductase [Paludibacter sp.]|jgi:short-subunit dehydrogenase|nr:SDR family oxidoreductase [Paludibacter sp.]